MSSEKPPLRVCAWCLLIALVIVALLGGFDDYFAYARSTWPTSPAATPTATPADAELAITTTYDQCLAEVLAGEVICLVGVGDQVDTALIGEPTQAECDLLANRGDNASLCVVTEGPQRGAVSRIRPATAREAS